VSVEKLARGVLEADPAAIAEALDRVEDARPQALAAQRELLARLAERTPAHHFAIGITGPPGAGKTSLTAALVRHWLAAGRGAGVCAVDPSSRRSGGALLGDRARLRFEADAPVFVRSLAARDQLGGLAPAARAAVLVLRAAYPVALLETVGVGQSEIDVETAVDAVVLVLQPASGDTLQFMKAGILEIPDVVAVNKWDLGALAERTRADFEQILAITPHGEAPPPGVVGTSAETGHGIAELAAALEQRLAQHAASGLLARRRDAGRAAWGLELFTRRYGTHGLDRLGGREPARQIALQAGGTGLDAFSALASRAGLS
jgi:LAO/AO transport system kinase